MKKIFHFCICFFLVTALCHGQPEAKQARTVIYGGIGLGLDYGGIGFKIEYLPVKHIGIFAGAGLNLDQIGYNGGLSWKILPDKTSTPFVIVMYGYNAVLKVTSPFNGFPVVDKTYYGFTAGAGYDFHVGKKNNKVSLAILVPFRSQEFEDEYNTYKDAGYEFKPDISPVLVSIGFNIGGRGK